MRPLFIMGCPRSGTTLLGDMLGAAKGVITLQESAFKFRGHDGQSTRQEIRSMRLTARWRLWDIEDQVPLSIPAVSDAQLYLIAAQAYVDKFAEGQTIHTFVDHTPDNARCAPMLARAFPEARFIHIVRDGRAVYNSVRKMDWGPSTPVRAANWWSTWLAAPLAMENRMHGRVHRLRYADLIRDPEWQLQAICDFAGVSYDPAMIDGGGLILSNYTQHNHRLVHKRPDPARIEAWRAELPEQEIAAFEWAVEGLLEGLGFSPRFKSRPQPPAFAKRVRWELTEMLRRGVRDALLVRARRRKMFQPLARQPIDPA